MDIKSFDRFRPEEYKRHAQEHWGETPCGSNTSGQEALTAEYFTEIERYRYDSHPWIVDEIKALDLDGRRVLEIGFGMGTDHELLARRGARTVGVDLTARNSQIVRKRFDLSGRRAALVVGDGERLPFADASFDFVYSFGVIHHAPDTERVVAEILRVLEPGGACWVSVYHRDSLFFWWSTFLYDWILHGGFRRETLKERLSRVEYPNDDPGIVVRLFSKRAARALFSGFRDVRVRVEQLQRQDVSVFGSRIPERWMQPLAKRFGWYVVIEARK